MRTNFRYSDTDFCAYLMTMGYKYTKIKVNRDKFNNIKAYVHFEGIRENLIDLYEEYQNGLATCNIAEFAKNRRMIVKLIKAKILIFQANNICKKEEGETR